MSNWKFLFDYKECYELVEENYNGNYPLQMPIYLFVDFEDKIIDAYTRNYNIGGIPIRQYNNIVQVFRLPNNVDASCLKQDIIDNYIKSFDNLYDSFEVEYINGNFQGKFNVNNIYATLYNIAIELEEGDNLTLNDNGGIWDIEDYYEYERPDVENLNDDEILELAKSEYDYIKSNGIIIYGGIDEIYNYFIDHR